MTEIDPIKQQLESSDPALDAMDVDLGYNVLNVWDDLTSRREPAALGRDAPAIVAALSRVVTRLPGLSGHAEALITRLRR